jgi:hypothetical protein
MMDSSIYVFLLVHRSMLHAVALSTVNDRRAVTISDVINKIYQKVNNLMVSSAKSVRITQQI